MIEMDSTFGSASDIQIASFEKKNVLKLPDDYRAFLRACNGGRPLSREFAVPGWDIFAVKLFFGLNTGNQYDLQEWVDALRDESRHNWIPVAVDSGGWCVFLGIGGPAQGRMFFIDTKDEDAQPLKIADSFAEFTGRLAPTGTFDDYVRGMPPKKAD